MACPSGTSPVCLVGLVYLVCLVFWLNETNQMNQINQINKTNQMNQTNQIDQTDQINETDETDRTDHMNKTGWRTFSASCSSHRIFKSAIRQARSCFQRSALLRAIGYTPSAISSSQRPRFVPSHKPYALRIPRRRPRADGEISQIGPFCRYARKFQALSGGTIFLRSSISGWSSCVTESQTISSSTFM